MVQEEADKRRQRAQKFGTPLVQNGLQPALTSKQAAKPKEVQQHAVGPSEAAPANAEMTDAGAQTWNGAFVVPCNFSYGFNPSLVMLPLYRAHPQPDFTTSVLEPDSLLCLS